VGKLSIILITASVGLQKSSLKKKLCIQELNLGNTVLS